MNTDDAQRMVAERFNLARSRQVCCGGRGPCGCEGDKTMETTTPDLPTALLTMIAEMIKEGKT